MYTQALLLLLKISGGGHLTTPVWCDKVIYPRLTGPRERRAGSLSDHADTDSSICLHFSLSRPWEAQPQSRSHISFFLLSFQLTGSADAAEKTPSVSKHREAEVKKRCSWRGTCALLDSYYNSRVLFSVRWEMADHPLGGKVPSPYCEPRGGGGGTR